MKCKPSCCIHTHWTVHKVLDTSFYVTEFFEKVQSCLSKEYRRAHESKIKLKCKNVNILMR